MPRLARLDTNPPHLPRPVPGRDGEGVADGGQAPGALHHVIGRDIDGIKLFHNRNDREDFLERLADLCKAVWCGCGALSWYKHFCC